jgi:hypothetical protein
MRHRENVMTVTPSRAIPFVADTYPAVAFHRDALGPRPEFASRGRVEFATGATSLALHASSGEHPPGTTRRRERIR